MFNSIMNPFKFSDEELLNYAVSDNRNEINEGETPLEKYGLLQNVYRPYNPYPEIEEDKIESIVGSHVASFYERSTYKPPMFSEDRPVEVMKKMNVQDVLNDYNRAEQMTATLGNLFGGTGNTPEERARDERISKLLEEINGFATQYNLSPSQKEHLQNQVLSGHIVDYLGNVRAIRNQDKQGDLAEKLSIAEGDADTGDAGMTRDAEKHARDQHEEEEETQEEEMREEEEETGGAAAGSGSGGGGGRRGMTGEELYKIFDDMLLETQLTDMRRYRHIQIALYYASTPGAKSLSSLKADLKATLSNPPEWLTVIRSIFEVSERSTISKKEADQIGRVITSMRKYIKDNKIPIDTPSDFR